MAVETLAIQQIGRGLFFAGWNAPGERLLVSRKQPGDRFPQGELLGRVESGAGETLQAITAPFDGVVLYQTHILGVSQGMPLLAYGKLRAEGGLSRQETERML